VTLFYSHSPPPPKFSRSQLSIKQNGNVLTSSGSIDATSYVPSQLRHVVAVHSPYTAVRPLDDFRRSTATAVSRPYAHRRRSRLQAAPPHTSPSSRPPPGRAYVSRTLYRQHGRLQAARTRHRRRLQAANMSARRRPHNYYASSARSSSTCRRLDAIR